MDLFPLRQVDNHRLEVVVGGVPLFRRVQLAIDTTMVFPVGSDRTARRQCAITSGAVLDQPGGPSWFSHTVAPGWWSWVARWGGRWSDETRQFFAGCAAAKARSEPEIMRKSTMLGWLQ